MEQPGVWGEGGWLLNLALKNCAAGAAQCQRPDGKVSREAAIHCSRKGLLCPRCGSSRRPQTLPGPWAPLILPGRRCRGQAGLSAVPSLAPLPPRSVGAAGARSPLEPAEGAEGSGSSIALRAADWSGEFCSQLCWRTRLCPRLRCDPGQVASLPHGTMALPRAARARARGERLLGMALPRAGWPRWSSKSPGTGRPWRGSAELLWLGERA